LAATYTLGGRLFGRVEGLVGAFLLAIAPFHLRYSQDARFYTLLVFLSLLSLYLLYRSLSSRRQIWFAAFVLCSVLNLYTHLFAFLVLAAQVVFVVGLGVAQTLKESKRGRSRDTGGEDPLPTVDKRLALTVGLCLIVIAVVYAPMAPHLLRGLGGEKGLSGGAARLDSSFLYHALDSWGLGSGWRILLLAVPVAIGIVASARSHWRQLWLVCCWILVPFVALIVVPAGHGFRPRYVLFMLPVYLLVAARGLTAVSDTVSERSAVRLQHARAVTLAALLGAVTLASIPALQAYYREDRADWRSVAALVASRFNAGDVIVSPGPFPQVVLPRYEGRLGREVFLIGGSEVILGQEEGQAGGVWFVGPAREKMRAIDEELVDAGVAREKAVFEVDGTSVARGRELKIAPVMYDDLWVIYVKQGL
jgi:4-amino-4-deoxy-L-arabinose transferase-like glycosyltransferase